jgi:hypothetical protein
MGKYFEQVKCSADIIFKIFSEEELTADQVRSEVVMFEVEMNERLGMLKLPDKNLKVGMRVHIKEVGTK